MEASELVGNNEAVFVLSSDLISRISAQSSNSDKHFGVTNNPIKSLM